MKNEAIAMPAHAPSGAPAEATIEALLGPRAVRVGIDGVGTLEATLAVAGYEPAIGDRVLVLASERAWVIGVVVALRAVPPVRAIDGVEARVSDGGRTLTVRDARGEVLFEHDATSGKSVVRSSGALEVRADGGDLDLSARDRVRIAAGRRVEIEGDEAVRLGARHGESEVALDARGVRVASTALEVVSGIGKLALAEGTFAVEKLETAVQKGRHFVGVMETRAGRIVERARDVYREVQDLEQTRAGRIRTIAREAYSVLADRATIKAEDDLTLMGEKIHLA